MNYSIAAELLVYRRLLEGSSDQEGLKQVVERVEETAKQQMSPSTFKPSTSYSYSTKSSPYVSKYSETNTASRYNASKGS